GNYLVSAHVSVTNFAGADAPVICHLYVNYDDSLSNPIDTVSENVAVTSAAGHIVDFPLQGSVLYTKAGFAVVGCEEKQNRSGSGDPGAASATLDAIQVAAIH